VLPKKQLLQWRSYSVNKLGQLTGLFGQQSIHL
jgi:hypothetical protein